MYLANISNTAINMFLDQDYSVQSSIYEYNGASLYGNISHFIGGDSYKGISFYIDLVDGVRGMMVYRFYI